MNTSLFINQVQEAMSGCLNAEQSQILSQVLQE